MKAEYVTCPNCGDLVWSPILYRHQRQRDCKVKAVMKAVESWYGARKLAPADTALRETTDEVLFQKAKDLLH